MTAASDSLKDQQGVWRSTQSCSKASGGEGKGAYRIRSNQKCSCCSCCQNSSFSSEERRQLTQSLTKVVGDMCNLPRQASAILLVVVTLTSLEFYAGASRDANLNRRHECTTLCSQWRWRGCTSKRVCIREGDVITALQART